jgi:hypothetical protein
MIVYQSSVFGLRNLLRVNGSPVYKVFIPTFFSTGFLLLLAWIDSKLSDERSVQHPYSIGAFIGFFSFLLTFRLNFAYQRYWEAATAVHHMLSKWVSTACSGVSTAGRRMRLYQIQCTIYDIRISTIFSQLHMLPGTTHRHDTHKQLDVAMTLAAWHYQAHSYDKIKPPAFGLNPLATSDAMQGRPHALAPSLETTKAVIAQPIDGYSSWYSYFQQKMRKMDELERRQRAMKKQAVKRGDFSVHAVPKSINQRSSTHDASAIPVPSRFQDHGRKSQSETDQRPSLTEQTPRGSVKLMRSHRRRTPAPSLFLQELAHLSSLLSAVAMSTLRNDIEMAESPLVRTTQSCGGRSFVCRASVLYPTANLEYSTIPSVLY